MSVSAPAPWEPGGGSEDLQQSFEEILNHISDTRKVPVTPQPRAVPAQATSEGVRRPEWKRVTTIGRELDPCVCLLGSSQSLRERPRERLKAWSPVTWAHKDSSFGFMGYLPEKDFNAWDKERVSNPERTWPADGAVSELYDTRRKGKPSWNPTNWVHKGRCFPMEAPSLPGQGLKIRRRRTPSFGTVSAESEIQRSQSHASVRATGSTSLLSPRSESSCLSSAALSAGSAARARSAAALQTFGPKEPLPGEERLRRKSEPGALGLRGPGPGPGRVWSTFGEVLEGPS